LYWFYEYLLPMQRCKILSGLVKISQA
jgi:hypothetical protein